MAGFAAASGRIRPAPPRARRGAKCWRYGWAEIAQVTGHTLATAKRYGQGRGRRFDPADLQSILAYAMIRKTGTEEKMK